MKYHRSLKNILSLTFALVAVIPIMIVGAVTLGPLSRSLEEEITTKNLSLARALAGEVSTFLNEPLSLLAQVADMVGKKQLLTGDAVTAYLSSVMGSYASFEMIQILDGRGTVTHVAPHDPEFMGIGMSLQPFYNLTRESGKPSWSPTFISMQTGHPTLTLSIPLEEGMVVGYLNLNTLGEMTGKLRIGRYGNAIITDQMGTAISHADRELVSQRWSLKDLGLVREGLRGREGTFREMTDEGPIIGSIAAVPQTGWLVIFYQRAEEAFNPLVKIRRVMVLSAFVTAVSALFISLAGLRRILRPLNRLMESAGKVAGGDYGKRPPPGGYTEIEELAGSFELMTRAVKGREKKLKELNEELDQRVRTRTAELEESLSFLRDTQKQLVEAEKMASLGGLVAGVAHEINTPVGIGITNNSFIEINARKILGLHREGRMRRSDFESFMELTLESVGSSLLNLNRAAELVQSFKLVSVDQALQERRRFDFREYVGEIVVSLRPRYRKGGHRVDLHIPEELVVDSYPGVFMQIITNLVTNSLIHGFGEEKNGRITISASREGEILILVYADSGKGMSEKVLENVFEPFFTTRRGKGGTGLGMHIVYNLVTQTLGGRIACESSEGKGVLFTLTVPLG